MLQQEIFYVYPKFRRLSFTEISKHHICYLTKYIKIQEIDEEVLDNIMWANPKNILLHPILYVTVGDKVEYFKARQKRLDNLLKYRNRLGGFETTDTDAVSSISVVTLNLFDVIFVPSTWSRNVLEKCGVDAPIEVLPHGLNSNFLREKAKYVAWLKDFKDKKNAILLLYFLSHSGYRKGADLVAKAVKRIQEKYSNVYLVVKRGNLEDPYMGVLRLLRTFEIAGWMDEEGLANLYDTCDIVLSPSRGGGFELNALEGIARAKPTLVTNAACFLDYVKYAIPLQVECECQIFRDNPIHIGKGYQVSLTDFIDKLEYAIENLRELKQRFKVYAKTVRQKYSWEKIGEKLFNLLKKYGFIV